MIKVDLKKSVLVGSVLFGSIVGAGFASGQEIWCYFAKFGWVCFPMIILAGILMFVLGYVFLEFGRKFCINSVQNMNNIIFKKYGILAEIIFIFSNIILLGSMFSASNSLFSVVFTQNLYHFMGVLTAILTLVITWLGFDKMIKINFLVVPSMVLVVLITFFIGVFSGHNLSIPDVTSVSNSVVAFAYCILYVCSNLFFAGFVFAKLGANYSKKINLCGAFLGASAMSVCILFTCLSIFLNFESSISEMPLVYIANSANHILGVFTLCVVFIGIVTTAVSLVYTISIWLEKYFGNFMICSAAVCFLCLLISKVGFTNIVKYLYPILGIFGIIFIVFLILNQYKNKFKRRNIVDKK